MPPVARVGMDLTSGHGSCPPITFSTGSGTVFCNNAKIVVQGSMHPPHGCPSPQSPAPQFLTQTSGTVFIENKGCGRIGDMDSCPECIATGSGNVICGG